MASKEIDYISRVRLPPVKPVPGIRSEAAPGVQLALDTAKNQAAVVGGAVISFVQGVTAERREAIANASLLAQMVANRKAKPDDLAGWYAAYFDSLSSLGWVIQNHTEAIYQEESENFSAHEAILAVATTLLGAAPTALAVVKSTLDALKSMDANSPWITLFNHQSQSGKTAHFQVTLVDQAAEGGFLISFMAFGLTATFELTQVLFFKFKKSEVTIRHGSGMVTIGSAVLEGVAEALKQKLVGYANAYIKTLPDLPPPPQGVTQRVIAHFMHESEREAARSFFKTPVVTDSFVIGDLDSNSIAALKAKGLIVQVFEEPKLDTEPMEYSTRAPASFGTDTFRGRRTRSASFSDPIGPDLSKPQWYRVWLNGPLLQDWRKEMEAVGANLSEALAGGAYKALMGVDAVEKTRELPFVRDVRLYDEISTRARRGLEKGAVRSGSAREVALLTYDILLHRQEDAKTTLDWLAQNKVAVMAAKGRKIRVQLQEDSALSDDISALTAVSRLEPYVKPKLYNDRARVLMGIETTGPGVGIAEQGEGQIIAIADTGIDSMHPDFAGRVTAKAWGRPSKTDDPDGHGTHVAGSAAGDGSASSGKLRGVAPKAEIFFQSLLDDTGDLGGLPLTLGDLFEEAYQAGARIHSNSWGADTRSRYVINSQEVDDFVAQHRDMLVIIAAGNEGTAKQNLNAAKGYVDWLSIGSPASCKNGLTVGASRSDRTTGGYSGTWGEGWPADYPDPPIAAEAISGDPQALAAFSSRGPCDDRRIKPDLVAPGTNILSCRSSISPKDAYWGPYTPNTKYAFDGGTSMATPLVAGCAVLVRQYYVTTRNHKPSAALLKATLINGTNWLTHVDATAERKGVPNYHQGFGALNMRTTIPNPTAPGFSLQFIDDWEKPSQPLKNTGDRVRYTFKITDPCPLLRICMAYTDLGARGLQNNINLFLQLPDNSKRFGNAKLPDTLNIPDPDNNVESIRIENAPSGTYLIQVSATNILKGPQDFALVIAGENVSSLTLFH